MLFPVFRNATPKWSGICGCCIFFVSRFNVDFNFSVSFFCAPRDWFLDDSVLATEVALLKQACSNSTSHPSHLGCMYVPHPTFSPTFRSRCRCAGALEPYLWMYVLRVHGGGGRHEPLRNLGQNQEQPVDFGEFFARFLCVVPQGCCVLSSRGSDSRYEWCHSPPPNPAHNGGWEVYARSLPNMDCLWRSVARGLFFKMAVGAWDNQSWEGQETSARRP